jgi:hypothetical protein
MTEPEEPVKDETDDDREDEAVRSLVRRALGGGAHAEEGDPPPNLLSGVQRRLRRRSRGKFYGDGWSTGQARIGHVLVAIVTLLLVALVYFGLGPIDVR